MDRRALSQAIREILAKTLCIRHGEISPTDRIFVDLPEDSLGMLEISFQIEKRLKIRFRAPEILDLKPYLDYRNRVSRESLDQLRREYPFLKFERLPADASADEFWQEMLTVEALEELVWRTAVAQGLATDTT